MKIIAKECLSSAEGAVITRIEVVAKDIARKVHAGQFVVVMAREEGERIPLTVVATDQAKGTITLIFQEAGFSTRLLGGLDVGDSLYALSGPLGHETEIKNYGKVILMGGGVGIAEVYPVAKAFKEAGNQVTTIVGSRTKNLFILEKELKEVSDEFLCTTDDGSYGRRGLVTDILKELFTQGAGGYGLVYAVGPIPMMRAVSSLTKEYKVKTIVSLNALMVDATGMCGSCRVSVGKEVKFACVDGPEFDAHGLDWDELTCRSKIYEPKEAHICRLDNP